MKEMHLPSLHSDLLSLVYGRLSSDRERAAWRATSRDFLAVSQQCTTSLSVSVSGTIPSNVKTRFPNLTHATLRPADGPTKPKHHKEEEDAVRCLSGCMRLTSLSICPAGNTSASSLCKALTELRGLSRLHLQSYQISWRCFEVLSDLPHLNDLSVGIKSHDGTASLHSNGTAKLLSQLTRLVVGDTSMISFCDDQALEVVGLNAKGLQVLECPGCIDVSDQGLEAALSGLGQTLKSLNLHSCVRISNSTVCAIARHATALTSLNLRGCIQVNDDGLAALASSVTCLKDLSLQNCNIQLGRACPPLHFPCLETLNLSHCDSLVSLRPVAGLGPSLTHLNISHCPLLPITELLLLANLTCLTDLRMAGMRYSCAPPDLEAFDVQLEEAFACLGELKVLDASEFKHPLGLPRGLLRGAARLPSLRQLDLSRCSSISGCPRPPRTFVEEEGAAQEKRCTACDGGQQCATCTEEQRDAFWDERLSRGFFSFGAGTRSQITCAPASSWLCDPAPATTSALPLSHLSTLSSLHSLDIGGWTHQHPVQLSFLSHLTSLKVLNISRFGNEWSAAPKGSSDSQGGTFSQGLGRASQPAAESQPPRSFSNLLSLLAQEPTLTAPPSFPALQAPAVTQQQQQQQSIGFSQEGNGVHSCLPCTFGPSLFSSMAANSSSAWEAGMSWPFQQQQGCFSLPPGNFSGLCSLPRKASEAQEADPLQEWIQKLAPLSVLPCQQQQLHAFQPCVLENCQSSPADSVRAGLSGLRHLNELRIEGCALMTDGWLDACGTLTALERLHLGGSRHITGSFLKGVAQSCSNLQTLSLDHCESLQDQHVAAACPQLRSLVKLDLAGNSSGSKVGDLTCQAIAGVGADEGAGLVRLCELSLRSCSVTARGVKALIEGNLPSLRSLSLACCSGVDDAALSLLLPHHQPSHVSGITRAATSACFTKGRGVELPCIAIPSSTDAGSLTNGTPQLQQRMLSREGSNGSTLSGGSIWGRGSCGGGAQATSEAGEASREDLGAQCSATEDMCSNLESEEGSECLVDCSSDSLSQRTSSSCCSSGGGSQEASEAGDLQLSPQQQAGQCGGASDQQLSVQLGHRADQQITVQPLLLPALKTLDVTHCWRVHPAISERVAAGRPCCSVAHSGKRA